MNLLQLPHWNREYDTQYVRGQVPKVFCGANNQSSLYAVLYLRITYRILVMIVCCAFIHSRIPGFWDLGIVYLCFQFLGIPFEFLIYYGAKFRNRWFLGLWLVFFCFKLITCCILKNRLNRERYLKKKTFVLKIVLVPKYVYF